MFTKPDQEDDFVNQGRVMDNTLTREEFYSIHSELFCFSDTWADLWMLLKLTNEKPSRLLRLMYTDEYKGNLVLKDDRESLEYVIILNHKARQ